MKCITDCHWEATISDDKHPTVSKLEKVPNMDLCQNHCQDNWACTFFVFNKASQKCLLKGSPFVKHDLTAAKEEHVVGLKTCGSNSTCFTCPKTFSVMPCI